MALALMVSFSLSIVACGQSSRSLFSTYEPGEGEDLANVFVNAYPPVPWAEVADQLEPKNNLTIEDARKLVAITTQGQLSQSLSTFGAGIAVGLPGITRTTTTTLSADGSKEITGTSISKSGDVPTASGNPGSSITIPTAVPGSATLTEGLGIDGSTFVAGSTALYQQAKILDNQITHAFTPPGYQGHLITFQINLQPKRRDLSFDTYVDIDLQPGDWSQAIGANASNDPPISVYPFIVTDAFETTSIARSIESIRQASLQLSGMIPGGAGISAGASGGTDKRDGVIGLDKNNLVTVGRVNHHAVRVRLGALNSGSSGMAMVPRTYNVSLVAFTRVGIDPVKSITRLYALTNTSFVSALDGKMHVVFRSRQKLAERVAKELGEYGFSFITDKCKQSYPEESTEKREANTLSKVEVTAHLELLRAVNQGDYQKVQTCLGLRDSLDYSTQFTLRKLLAELSEIQIDSKHATMLLHLRDALAPSLPEETQLIEIVDDEKTSLAILRGGQGLYSHALHAELQLDKTTALRPVSIAIKGDGREIQLAFTSLRQLGMKPSNSDNALLKLSLRNTRGMDKKYRVKMTSMQKAPK